MGTEGKDSVSPQAKGKKARQEAKKGGKAYLPSTVLTVEYVEEGADIDSAVRQMSERLRKLAERLDTLDERYQELLSSIKQQNREAQGFVQSLFRRIDQIYRCISGEGAPVSGQPAETAQPAAADIGSPGTIPEAFADDPEHQNALRVARVMASDLAGYFPDELAEGALYGSFLQVLEEPIAEARRTYDERVPERVRDQFDYFRYALQELVAGKRNELESEESAGDS